MNFSFMAEAWLLSDLSSKVLTSGIPDNIFYKLAMYKYQNQMIYSIFL